MSADRSTIVHATTVACQGSAVLLRGAPGAGKSDLALRLLTSCQTPILASPFMLVADDQTVLRRDGSRLVASPPETLAGLLEVRGVGIVPLPFAAEAVVALVVDLSARAEIERLPEPASTRLLDVLVPLIRLPAFDASSPAKVALALAAVIGALDTR
ncbi:MAG: HPr kinase/phosphatase C-terminal domain-containing protein [Hyphomicrobiaceae bacterium]|nr:HPr kinase/phosphatase C-terminal domain-containing protein [Hyphomicrobiaceae bacterium]